MRRLEGDEQRGPVFPTCSKTNKRCTIRKVLGGGVLWAGTIFCHLFVHDFFCLPSLLHLSSFLFSFHEFHFWLSPAPPITFVMVHPSILTFSERRLIRNLFNVLVTFRLSWRQTCKCNAKSSLLSAGVRNPIDVELFTPKVEGEEIDDDLNSENNNS